MNNDDLVKRLKRAEIYFLDIAEDLADPEALHAECCYRAIKAIESLQARVKELESPDRTDLCFTQARKIVSLAARVKELEEKAEFNERWITQTCETGQIKAERNQNIATDAVWILTVSPLPEHQNDRIPH